MKKKGFTLIELLAVIVILAIIALIAVPIVLNIINNSKESAKLRSAELYLDAVNNAIAQYQLGDNEIVDGTYEIMSDGNICLGTITDGICDNTLEVSVDGEIPDSGFITLESSKIVDFATYYGEDRIVKGEQGNYVYEENMAPGLYDKKGKMLASFDELVNDYGLDIETDYTTSTFKTGKSMYNILNNNEELSSGVKFVISNNIEKIGKNVFRICRNLKSIEIPASVTSIGEDAFWKCSSLESIIIPNSVTSIGLGAFSGCIKLKTIEVDENNTIYDSRDNSNAIIQTSNNSLVVGCKGTVIPNSVTSIGEYAFEGCSSLTSIEIPASVTSIGDSAFIACSGLTSIIIPEKVTSIGKYTFGSCSNLSSVELPIGLLVIGEYAFHGCRSLASLEIPNSVTNIEHGAFYWCGLRSIKIPSSVTSIGTYAFGSCSELNSIIVDENNTVYDSRDNSNAIIETATNTLLFGTNSTVIPSSVTSLGTYAFGGRTGLTSITIPSSVTSIGEEAFYACDNLVTVYFEHETAPTFGSYCFYSLMGEVTTFYFKNSTVADAFTTSYYNSSYGTKSTDYSW